MFYAHFILSKKGPLARIWLAAHWDKKLTKSHIFETNIEGCVEAIMRPQVKLALRTSGHLMLGVVRIYSRKAKYLLADCNEAIVKIKMAFRPGAVDLPAEGREAAVSAVTMQENFHDFDTFLADLPVLPEYEARLPFFSTNQSQPEEITLREDVRAISFTVGDDFGDFGFEGASFVLPEANNDYNLYAKSVREPDPADSLPNLSVRANMNETSWSVAEPMETDDDLPPEKSPLKLPDAEMMVDDNANVTSALQKTTSDVYDYEVPADEEREGDRGVTEAAELEQTLNDASVQLENEFGGQIDHDLFGEVDGGGLFEEPKTPAPPPSLRRSLRVSTAKQQQQAPDQTTVPDQTTLISNDAEAFALGPIDATNLGTERKSRKKRKLIVDEVKLISSDAMRAQLGRSADLITPLDLAPPTKKLMEWREIGGADRLLTLPGKRLVNRKLCLRFTHCLVTRSVSDEEYAKELRASLEANREAAATKRTRQKSAEEAELEVRRAASLAGGDTSVANVSRVSFAADVHRSADDVLPDDRRSVADTSLANITVASVGGADLSTSIAADQSVLAAANEIEVLPPLGDVSLASLPAVHDMSSMIVPSPGPADVDVPVIPCLDETYVPEPMSVAPPTDDENIMAFDETMQSAAADNTMLAEAEAEEDEAKLLNRRSGQLLTAVRKALKRRSEVTFDKLTVQNSRKQAAAKFYTLLVLKKFQAVNIAQSESFGDIHVTRGPAFNKDIVAK